MAITGENLFNEYRNIVNADTADTFVTVLDGGSTQGKIISLLCRKYKFLRTPLGLKLIELSCSLNI